MRGREGGRGVGVEEDGEGVFVLGKGGRGLMEVWDVIGKGKGDGGGIMGGGVGLVEVEEWKEMRKGLRGMGKIIVEGGKGGRKVGGRLGKGVLW